MQKFTTKEKRQLLARLIEIKVFFGENITDLMFKPMKYFDWEKVSEIVKTREKEIDES